MAALRLLFHVIRIILGNRSHAPNPIQRRANIMAHAAQKIRLCYVGGTQLAPLPLQIIDVASCHSREQQERCNQNERKFCHRKRQGFIRGTNFIGNENIIFPHFFIDNITAAVMERNRFLIAFSFLQRILYSVFRKNLIPQYIIIRCGNHRSCCILHNINRHPFNQRQPPHNLADITILHPFQQSVRRYANLHQCIVIFCPDHRIHHRLTLCRIRRYILAKGKRMVRKHRLKKPYLFPGIHCKAIIFWNRSVDDFTFFIKHMHLVHP